jgi:surface protein
MKKRMPKIEEQVKIEIMIYLHENGVTVVANNEAKRGKVYEFNGEKYYIARGVADIKRIIDSKEYPLNKVITSKLTSLNSLFQIQGGYSQAAVPDNFNDDISNWDTSNVLSMEEVFSGWPKFNQDISNWNTSRVESMHGMFKSSKYVGNYYMGPTSFNQDISNWDVSNVKNMSEMFLGSTSFNQGINNWDVSNVENMDHMFGGATSFNQPIGNWDTRRVESMRGMFSDVLQ